MSCFFYSTSVDILPNRICYFAFQDWNCGPLALQTINFLFTLKIELVESNPITLPPHWMDFFKIYGLPILTFALWQLITAILLQLQPLNYLSFVQYVLQIIIEKEVCLLSSLCGSWKLNQIIIEKSCSGMRLISR